MSTDESGTRKIRNISTAASNSKITRLAVLLFGLLLWQVHQRDWGSFLLLLAAEAGLIAIRVTSTTPSKRI